MKVCLPSSFVYRKVPSEPGAGFRFVRVGELRRAGDEYFTDSGEWRPAQVVTGIVSEARRNLYRRRIES